MRRVTQTVGATFSGVLAGVCLVALIAGCSSPRPAITSSASGVLDREVQAIRTAASQQDPAVAESQVTQLRATVAQLEGQGQLDSVRAASILSAADVVEAQLAAVTTTAPTTTSTSAPAPPAKPGKPKPGHGGDGGGPGGGAGGGPGGGAGG